MPRTLWLAVLVLFVAATVSSQTKHRTEAVETAIRWLRGQQNPDGSFGNASESPYGRVGLTGLTLLVMLGDGSTMRSGPHKSAIKRAVIYLRNGQVETGMFSPADAASVVEHTIATIAMAEAYGRSAYKVIKKNAVRGCRYIRSREKVDTETLAWELILNRALTRFRLPDLATHINKVGPPVLLGNAGKRQAAAQRLQPALRMPVRLLWQALAPGAKPLTVGKPSADTGVLLAAAGQSLEQHDPMFWYLGSVAMHAHGGVDAKLWQNLVTKAIAKARNVDGSWGPVGEGKGVAGKIYQTTLFTMIQQVASAGRIPTPQPAETPKGR